MNVETISRELNAVAREQFPHLNDKLGIHNKLGHVLPRVALRQETLYPYRLIEDDVFYPRQGFSFGRLIQATRDEGLRAIHAEIETRGLEHGWVFCEESNIWVDNTLDAAGPDIDTDQYITTFLSYLTSSVEDVHTHPDMVVATLATEGPLLDYGPDYRAGAALPSTQDYRVMVQMNSRVNSQAQYSASVVSHYGVTTYALLDRSAVRGKGVHFSEVSRNISADEPIEGIRTMLATSAMSATFSREDTPVMTINFQQLK